MILHIYLYMGKSLFQLLALSYVILVLDIDQIYYEIDWSNQLLRSDNPNILSIRGVALVHGPIYCLLCVTWRETR